MKSVLSFALITQFLGVVFGLKCAFLTVDLTSEERTENNQTPKEEQKEYECPKEDKYCVLLEGELGTEPDNLTFSIRSCESDVKRYMDPISEKMDENLEYSCEEADGKNRSVGPITYWYNCCAADYCNSASSLTDFSLFLTSLVVLGMISSKIFK